MNVENRKSEILFKCGDWFVDNRGIVLSKDGDEEFYNINTHDLWNLIEDMWAWPITIVEKLWITDMEIYQFNTVFFYAIYYFSDQQPKNFPEISVFKTLKAQQKLIAKKKGKE
jgi:hypothetical protein